MQQLSGGGSRLLPLNEAPTRRLSPVQAHFFVAMFLISGYVGYAVYANLTDLDAAPATPPAYVPAFVTSLETTVSATGSIEASNQAELSFGVSGQVAEVLVSLGEEVVEGQALARLEEAEHLAAFEIAEANLALAEARLATALGPAVLLDISAAQQSLGSSTAQQESAQATLDRLLASPTENEVRDAERAVLVAEISLASARADLGGDRSDDRQRAVDSAELALASAKQTLVETKSGPTESEISIAQLNLDSAEASLLNAQTRYSDLFAAPKAEILLPLEVSVIQARVAFTEAEANLEAATIRAAFGGQIGLLNGEVGDTVQANQLVLTLVERRALEVGANFDQADFPSLSVGQEAVVSIDALPGSTFDGIVTAIGLTPTIQQGIVSYPVIITLLTASLDASVVLPAPGMSAAVDVITNRVEDALVVPSSAISAAQGSLSVTIRTATGDEVRPIVTGESEGTLTQVLSGLAPGDDVRVSVASSGSAAAAPAGIPGNFPGGGGGGFGGRFGGGGGGR